MLEKTLERVVREQRESAGLVGLGAVVIQNGKLIGPSVSGERKKGSLVPLTESDRWHIGSITKSVTATMLARLVEKGQLNWNSSVKEIFFDVEGIHSGWNEVTLHHLLSHTAGAKPDFPLSIRLKKPAEGVERKAAREAAVRKILTSKPQSEPGSTFLYSNVGYTIAGVMAEKKTGLVWEELIRQEIFHPLNLQNGGFGPPRDKTTKLGQPRGHRTVLGFTFAAGPDDDNTPIMGPAGTLHLSLEDLAHYGNEHLQGERNQGLLLEGSLLDTQTFQRLHKPTLKRYAYGWVVSARKKLGVGPVIWHNGSNTMWYALLAFMPKINAVIAVTSNDGNIKPAKQSAWEIVGRLAPLLATATESNP